MRPNHSIALVSLLAFSAGLIGVASPASAASQTSIVAALRTGHALPGLQAWTGDLDGMTKRRLIRILVPYSKTIYFLDKGEQLGTAVEWGTAFGDEINRGKSREIDRIRIAFIPTPRARLLSDLVQGKGDIAAGSLTITPERLGEVDFSAPFATGIREEVVAGPSAPPLAKLNDLSGKTLYVRTSSSYAEHLNALNVKLTEQGLAPIKLVPADENLEDEDLLEMVNADLLPYAVVDSYKADIWSKVFPALKVHNDVVINDGGQLAWALRKNSPLLKVAIDKFVATHKIGTAFGNILRNRYYVSDKIVRQAYSLDDAKRYNDLVQLFHRYGSQYHFDYLMMAAQGFQESELDQSKRNPTGAVGVMQILPSTALSKPIGIAGVETSAERNIEAGNKYMRRLVDVYINDPTVDAKNQLLFAMAAYNAGPGNLVRIRARARHMGLDPNVWFGNVEVAAAAIVGNETVRYVSNIYKYFVAYSLLEQQASAASSARRDVPQK